MTGQRKHPEIKRLGCPTGAAHLQGQGFNELAVQALKDQRRRAGGGSGVDDRRLEGRGHHVRQRPGRRAQRSGLCDASGRPMDGQERSQRHGSAVLNIRWCHRRAGGAGPFDRRQTLRRGGDRADDRGVVPCRWEMEFDCDLAHMISRCRLGNVDAAGGTLHGLLVVVSGEAEERKDAFLAGWGRSCERGNVMGLMPHPERAADALMGSTDGRVILESMVHSLVASVNHAA